MKRILVLTCLMMLVSLPVMARSIEGANNEVADPWFQDPTAWYANPGWSVIPFTDGTLQGGYTGVGGSDLLLQLRTIVDDRDGLLWNEEYNIKEIDFTFYGHLDGNGYVRVRFDWWNDREIPRPDNDPQISPPDGVTDWYYAYADGTGDFELRPDLILPDEEPGWFASAPLNFHDIWDHQPRWISIEIECITGGGTGGEAYITGIDFEAQCIPEPTTMLLVGLGALLGLYRKIRR